MKHLAVTVILLAGAVLAPTESVAQISCSREGLQRAIDLYIAAQTSANGVELFLIREHVGLLHVVLQGAK